MEGKAHNFKELRVWKGGMDMVDLCYDFVQDLPNNEKYNLVSQIVRCGNSIPANIAERCGKRTKRHFAEFVTTSLSSCFELETYLLICERRSFGNEELRNKMLAKVLELKNMIHGFRETLN